MDTLLSILQLSAYFISLTLAGYLLSRGRFHPLSIAAAGVLMSYALIQADLFLGHEFGKQVEWLSRLLWLAYPLPVAMWARIAILLKPGDQLALDRAWWTLLMPIAVVLILGGWVGNELMNFQTHDPGPLFWTYGVYNVGVTATTAWLLRQNFRATAKQDRAYRAFAVLRLAGLAYLSGMLCLLPGWFSPAFVFAIVVLDVMTLGIAAILYDAIAEGQAVRRDLSFTMLKVVLALIVIVTPWSIAMLSANTWTPALALALFGTLAVISLGIPLAGQIEQLLDRLLFKPNSGDAQAREALRTLMLNEVRRPETSPAIASLDQVDFVRLTRRALSHMQNLPRLAASPLTDMQIVAQRLHNEANSIHRAHELRQVLTECIETLRPPSTEKFGTSDEWRFFNALYYPYVIGVSPYKNHYGSEEVDSSTATMLKWFQINVPPRTLYNWQNRGAEMIAELLLERENQA
ncbi:MAG: hypothetical protein HY862_21920 [Chloroflexi bacterium]|nr:hypothetical protein [Chloroflexota bacterium]